jgi:hypothetical protein
MDVLEVLLHELTGGSMIGHNPPAQATAITAAAAAAASPADSRKSRGRASSPAPRRRLGRSQSAGRSKNRKTQEKDAKQKSESVRGSKAAATSSDAGVTVLVSVTAASPSKIARSRAAYGLRQQAVACRSSAPKHLIHTILNFLGVCGYSLVVLAFYCPSSSALGGICGLGGHLPAVQFLANLGLGSPSSTYMAQHLLPLWLLLIPRYLYAGLQ